MESYSHRNISVQLNHLNTIPAMKDLCSRRTLMVLISIPFSSQREQRQLTNVLRNFTEQYRPKFGSEGTEVVDTLHRSTLEAMFKKYSGKIEQEIKANVEDNPLTLE
ncbi:MAG: hypothetical protein ACI9S8_000198, partial [Chlamydiales bacterium]